MFFCKFEIIPDNNLLKYPPFYSLQFLYFLFVMTVLTCSLVLAARKPDPRVYDTLLDVFRGVCEGLSIISIGYNGIAELNQLKMFVGFRSSTTLYD